MAITNIVEIEKPEIDIKGRPCKYASHVEPYLDKVYQWIKDGMTDYSIAENLGIHKYTFIRYKEMFNDLSDLYTRACLERNRLVMNRMYKRACGEKAQVIKQKALKDGQIVDLKEEVYIPPDVNAADLYLRNNDPEYKSAKSDQVIINNSPSLPPDQLESKLSKLLAEYTYLCDKAKAIDVISNYSNEDK